MYINFIKKTYIKLKELFLIVEKHIYISIYFLFK